MCSSRLINFRLTSQQLTNFFFSFLLPVNLSVRARARVRVCVRACIFFANSVCHVHFIFIYHSKEDDPFVLPDLIEIFDKISMTSIGKREAECQLMIERNTIDRWRIGNCVLYNSRRKKEREKAQKNAVRYMQLTPS